MLMVPVDPGSAA